jgi:hypothetical protein
MERRIVPAERHIFDTPTAGESRAYLERDDGRRRRSSA